MTNNQGIIKVTECNTRHKQQPTHDSLLVRV